MSSPRGEPPSLTLVGHAAFRAFRNVWMLEEMGLPYAHVEASPRSREARAANPFGKIPSLRDGDFVMYESAAINTYLGDAYGALSSTPGLVPTPGTHQRGRYEQVVSTLQTEMDSQCLWIHRKHEALAQWFGKIPDAVSHAQKHFNSVLKVLIQQMNDWGGPFVIGDQFTAADILFVHCLDWAAAIGWLETAELTGEERSALTAYHDSLKSRPAYLNGSMKKKSKM